MTTIQRLECWKKEPTTWRRLPCIEITSASRSKPHVAWGGEASITRPSRFTSSTPGSKTLRRCTRSWTSARKRATAGRSGRQCVHRRGPARTAGRTTRVVAPRIPGGRSPNTPTGDIRRRLRRRADKDSTRRITTLWHDDGERSREHRHLAGRFSDRLAIDLQRNR